MNENKKTVYLNQGSCIPDYLCTGISRAYLEGDNLIIILESVSGIENEHEKFLNEVVRIVVPSNHVLKLGDNFAKAISYALSSNKKDIINETVMPSKDTQDIVSSPKSKERLGKPLF